MPTTCIHCHEEVITQAGVNDGYPFTLDSQGFWCDGDDADQGRHDDRTQDDDQDDEYESVCPACGSPISYCQGHGEYGDPIGFAILKAHDNGDHTVCAEGAYCVD
jgi:hypothetical protein